MTKNPLIKEQESAIDKAVLESWIKGETRFSPPYLYAGTNPAIKKIIDKINEEVKTRDLG